MTTARTQQASAPAHNHRDNMNMNEVDRSFREMTTAGGLAGVMPATYTRDQAAHYLGVKSSWLANNAGTSRAPVHVKLGAQVRYLHTDLDGWLRQQRVTA